MELRQLQYFLTVAEELNFGRAAALRLPATTFSQIRQLEQELGVELFVEPSAELSWLQEGYLEEARQILLQVEQGAGTTC